MKKIMVLNSGSSTVKFKLFDSKFNELAEGLIDRIGQEKGEFIIKYNEKKEALEISFETHSDGIQFLLNKLTDLKILENLNEITMVGHRIVQGGEIFQDAVIVGDKELEQIYELAKLAPLHNKPNGDGIAIFKDLLPSAINVAVFDTVYHQTMKPEEYIYPLPYELYENYQVRRYGAHGTSHKYVVNKVLELENNNNLKVINCHIGAGASLCATEGGKCVTTSMGLTPLGGIMMATRCGDLDPSVVNYINEQTGMSVNEINEMMNKKSGLLGVSKISGDCRDISSAIDDGDELAILSLEIYVNKIVDYIASYYVKLNGVDVISLTAGVGENAGHIRKMIMERLSSLGVKLDNELNDIRSSEPRIISSIDSKIKVYVIPTEEELQIAKETFDICK